MLNNVLKGVALLNLKEPDLMYHNIVESVLRVSHIFLIKLICGGFFIIKFFMLL